MLETLLAQTQIAYALSFGRKFSPWALQTLVNSIQTNQIQFNTPPLRGEQIVEDGQRDLESAKEFHFQRFQQQSQIAIANAPYYRNHWRSLIENIESYEDIAQLPLTNKQTLRDYPDWFVNETIPQTIRTMTTGTTGWPTYIYLSHYELNMLTQLGAADLLARRIANKTDIVQICYSARALHINVGTGGAFARLGASIYQLGQVEPEYALKMLAEERSLKGKKAKTSILLIYPSYLAQLIEYAHKLGYTPDDFGLEGVVTGGEMLTEGIKNRAKAVFGEINFFEGYALTEVIPMGGTRTAVGNLHFEASHGLTEIINPDTGKPAKIGEFGTIVVTPYLPFRETTLLLRYDTQDLVQCLNDPLLSSTQEPTASHILGKLKHAVRHQDGWVFTRDVQEALDALPQVPLPSRYSFLAHDDGVMVQVFVPKPTEKLRKQIANALEAKAIPLRKLILVDQPDALTNPMPLRCDMREHTIGLHKT